MYATFPLTSSRQTPYAFADAHRLVIELSVYAVAFKVYDVDRDGYISNGELFIVLKMMVGNNLRDAQLQQIVDKTVMEADQDGDGKISFDEFCAMIEDTDIVKQVYLTMYLTSISLSF